MLPAGPDRSLEQRACDEGCYAVRTWKLASPGPKTFRAAIACARCHPGEELQSRYQLRVGGRAKRIRAIERERAGSRSLGPVCTNLPWLLKSAHALRVERIVMQRVRTERASGLEHASA